MNTNTISATVIKAYGKFFHVRYNNKHLQCVIRDSLKSQAESVISPVVVGDRIDLTPIVDINQSLTEDNTPHGVIEKVHPRKTRFSRPKRGKQELEQIVAANIDQLMIITSTAKPQFKQALIDRFLIAASIGGLEAVIVINKIDLEHNLDLKRLEEIYGSVDVPILKTSAPEKTGLDKFKAYLKDKISIVAGQSGVGKSSLLNAIEENLGLRVSDISEATQKGVHTTTAVEMFPLSGGGYVVDSPGLKYLGLWDLEADDLQHYFPEIARYASQCKFRNCKHKAEPGCAVKKALRNDEIYAERYQNYLKIMDELETNSLQY